MKNAAELRDALTSVWHDLRARKIKVEEAESLANIAGKMLVSAKLELEYAVLIKKPLVLPFLTEKTAPDRPAAIEDSDTIAISRPA